MYGFFLCLPGDAVEIVETRCLVISDCLAVDGVIYSYPIGNKSPGAVMKRRICKFGIQPIEGIRLPYRPGAQKGGVFLSNFPQYGTCLLARQGYWMNRVFPNPKAVCQRSCRIQRGSEPGF